MPRFCCCRWRRRVLGIIIKSLLTDIGFYPRGRLRKDVVEHVGITLAEVGRGR